MTDAIKSGEALRKATDAQAAFAAMPALNVGTDKDRLCELLTQIGVEFYADDHRIILTTAAEGDTTVIWFTFAGKFQGQGAP